MRQKIQIATYVWAAIIMALSITPGNYIPPIAFDLIAPDTIAHVGFYFVLSMLMPVSRGTARHNGVELIALLLIAVMYGFFIELIQGNFIPGRYFDYFDILSNTAGTMAGTLLYVIIQPALTRRLQ